MGHEIYENVSEHANFIANFLFISIIGNRVFVSNDTISCEMDLKGLKAYEEKKEF